MKRKKFTNMGSISIPKLNKKNNAKSSENSTKADELTKQGEFDPEAAQKAVEDRKQEVETTKKYISIDYEQLKKCALPMPILQSPYYGKGGII